MKKLKMYCWLHAGIFLLVLGFYLALMTSPLSVGRALMSVASFDLGVFSLLECLDRWPNGVPRVFK